MLVASQELVHDSFGATDSHLLLRCSSAPIQHTRVGQQIMRFLLTKDGWTSSYEIIQDQDGCLEEFYDTLCKLKCAGLISENDDLKVKLSAMGRRQAEWLGNRPSFTCPSCDSKGYAHTEPSLALVGRFKEIAATRPEPDLNFDQQFIVPEDLFLRAALMDSRGDLLGKDILIIGDDDLFSIALALTGLPRKVVVLEIDERIVAFLNATAKRLGLPVEAASYDITHALPDAYRAAADVFCFDPVETVDGFTTWLVRGVQGLRPGGAVYFGMTTQESSSRKWFAMQMNINRLGLAITDVKRNFSRYLPTSFDDTFLICKRLGPNADGVMWYASSFVRLERVCEAAPVALAQDGNIYIDAERWATPVLL